MNKNLLLAVASGLLLGIPFCIPSLFFLILFAWIPLLWIEDINYNHHNPYVLFNYSLISFLLWNTMAYWWVSKAQIIGVIFIILANSLLLALVFWLISKSRKALKISIFFPFLIIWLGFEYFHTWWDLAWPWLNLGNAFASAPSWIQWYEFTGSRGGSLWIILINYSLFKIMYNKKRGQYQQIIILLLLYGIPLLWSVNKVNTEADSLNCKSYGLIQPNLDPYTEKFQKEQSEQHFADFLKTTDSLLAQHQLDYLLGPETVVLESINEINPKESNYYLQLLKLKRKHPNTTFFLGVHSHIGSKNFNSALFLADTVHLKFYHKTKLVPLFERIPFDKYLSFLNDHSLEIGGYKGTYYSNNDIDYFSNTDSTSLIPIICFESVFGDYCAQRIPETEGFICMLTNDGWWKSTPGYKHHFNFSRLRAIESRHNYIRVANNGISAQINSKGMVLASTKWWKKSVLTGNIPLRKERTFYSEHGDFIGRTCLFVATLLLIFVKIRVSSQSKTRRSG